MVNLQDQRKTLKSTLSTIKVDIGRYDIRHPRWVISLAINAYNHPALIGIIYYRLGSWLWFSRNNILFRIALIMHRIGYFFVRALSGVELPVETKIGKGLCIMHFGHTVLNPGVIAGENLTLFHNVTIGARGYGVPVLGKGVFVGAGAIIIGNIKIGDYVDIGAGAVVVHDIPDCCRAIGVSAKATPKEH